MRPAALFTVPQALPPAPGAVYSAAALGAALGFTEM